MVPERTGFPQAAPEPQDPRGGISLHLKMCFPSMLLCLMHAGCVGQGKATSQSLKQNPKMVEGATFVSHTAFRIQLPAWIPSPSWLSPSTLSASGSLSVLNLSLWLKDRDVVK